MDYKQRFADNVVLSQAHIRRLSEDRPAIVLTITGKETLVAMEKGLKHNIDDVVSDFLEIAGCLKEIDEILILSGLPKACPNALTKHEKELEALAIEGANTIRRGHQMLYKIRVLIEEK